LPDLSDADGGISSGLAALQKLQAGVVSERVPETVNRTNDPSQHDPAVDEQERASKPRAKTSPPAVDLSAVTIVDAIPGAQFRLELLKPAGTGAAAEPASAPRQAFHTEKENRRIGRHGEEVVYHAERQRLSKLGKNPNSVRWVSRVNELSPYDIVSIDEDNQLIYLEVKSTNGTAPTETFYISHRELIEATVRRSRYYIYRVTHVDAAVPIITRWADPLGLIKSGKGQLLLQKAQMALSLADEAEDE